MDFFFGFRWLVVIDFDSALLDGVAMLLRVFGGTAYDALAYLPR